MHRKKKIINDFLIITHVDHIQTNGKLFAYAPYVHEMNIWCGHARNITILAPVKKNPPSEIDFPYSCFSSKVIKIPSFNVLSVRNAMEALFKMPIIIFKMIIAMKRADHVHLRCPGNIGLIACFLQILFPGKAKSAKYAGNWDPRSKQPWSYKLQKWVLANPFLTRNMKVLVYGKWGKESKNILPFFTASFSKNLIPQEGKKTFSPPFTFLFVGKLVKGKNPFYVVKLLEELIAREISARLEVFGDGPEKVKLERYCQSKNLKGHVFFRGNRPLVDLVEEYKKAHFVVLPSRSEGWPKAIAEGMFFGCIPIATRVSCLPWMLNYGKRGVLLDSIPERNFYCTEGYQKNQESSLEISADKIQVLLKNNREMRRKSLAARKWSQDFTLEEFERAVEKVLGVGAV